MQCISKKSCSVLYDESLYKHGQDFLDMQQLYWSLDTLLSQNLKIYKIPYVSKLLNEHSIQCQKMNKNEILKMIEFKNMRKINRRKRGKDKKGPLERNIEKNIEIDRQINWKGKEKMF